MSHGYQKQTHVHWWLWAAILLLLTIVIVSPQIGSMQMPAFMSLGANESNQAPDIETLRAARPDFVGGSIPESTMLDKSISVETLRAVTPDFSGAYVPESTMFEQSISVETLRAAKPDFTGGAVPESTYNVPSE